MYPYLKPDPFFTNYPIPQIELLPRNALPENWLILFSTTLFENLQVNPANYTADSICKLIQKLHLKEKQCNSDLSEQARNSYIQREKKRVLEFTTHLQELYQILNQDWVTQKSKQLISQMLISDLKECSDGVHNRVKYCIKSLYYPKNVKQLLTKIREKLLEDVSINVIKELELNVKKGLALPNCFPPSMNPNRRKKILSAAKKESVHLLNHISRIASPIVGISVLNTLDTTLPDGIDEVNIDIGQLVTDTFKKNYQLFSIIIAIINEIKSLLENKGYYLGWNKSGYKEIDYTPMKDIISELLETDFSFEELFVLDEDLRVQDINSVMLSQTIFTQFIVKGFVSITPDSETARQLKALFEKRRNNPAAKFNLDECPLQILPLANAGTQAMLDALEFYHPYLQIDDISKLDRTINWLEVPHFFCHYSPSLQNFLLSCVPENSVLMTFFNTRGFLIQSEIENLAHQYHQSSSIIQNTIIHLSVNKIDHCLNKIILLPNHIQIKMLSNLNEIAAFLSKFFLLPIQIQDSLLCDPASVINHKDLTLSDHQEYYRLRLIILLKQTALDNDACFSIQKKRAIYAELWQDMRAKFELSNIHTDIFNHLSLKASYSSSTQELIADIYPSLIWHDFEENTVEKNELQQHLFTLQNLTPESKTTLIELLEQEEQGVLSPENFEKALIPLIDAAPYYFLNWLLADDQIRNGNLKPGDRRGQLAKILGNVLLIFNKTIPNQTALLILNHTDYPEHLIFSKKILNEIEKMDIESIFSYLKILNANQHAFENIQLPEEVFSSSENKKSMHSLFIQSSLNKLKKYSPKNINEFVDILLKYHHGYVNAQIKNHSCSMGHEMLSQFNAEFYDRIIVNEMDFIVMQERLSENPATQYLLYEFWMKISEADFSTMLPNKALSFISKITNILHLGKYLWSFRVVNEEIYHVEAIAETLLNYSYKQLQDKNLIENKIKLLFLKMVCTVNFPYKLSSTNCCKISPADVDWLDRENLDEYFQQTKIAISVIKEMDLMLKKYVVNNFWNSIRKIFETNPEIFENVNSIVKKSILTKLTQDMNTELSAKLLWKVCNIFSVPRNFQMQLIERFLANPIITFPDKKTFHAIFSLGSNHHQFNLIEKILADQLLLGIDSTSDIISMLKAYGDKLPDTIFSSLEFEKLLLSKLIPSLKNKFVCHIFDIEWLLQNFNPALSKQIFDLMPPDIELDSPRLIHILSHCDASGTIALLEKLKEKNIILQLAPDSGFTTLQKIDDECFKQIIEYPYCNIFDFFISSELGSKLFLYSANQQKMLFERLYNEIKSANQSEYSDYKLVHEKFKNLLLGHMLFTPIKKDALSIYIDILNKLHCFVSVAEINLGLLSMTDKTFSNYDQTPCYQYLDTEPGVEFRTGKIAILLKKRQEFSFPFSSTDLQELLSNLQKIMIVSTEMLISTERPDTDQMIIDDLQLFKEILSTLKQGLTDIIPDIINFIGKSKIDNMINNHHDRFVDFFCSLSATDNTLLKALFHNISNSELKKLLDSYLELPDGKIEAVKIQALITQKRYTIADLLQAFFKEFQVDKLNKLCSFLLSGDNPSRLIQTVEDIDMLKRSYAEEKESDSLLHALRSSPEKKHIYLNYRAKKDNQYTISDDLILDDDSTSNSCQPYPFGNSFFSSTFTFPPMLVTHEQNCIKQLAALFQNYCNTFKNSRDTDNRRSKLTVAKNILFPKVQLDINTNSLQFKVAEEIANWIRQPTNSSRRMSDYWSFIANRVATLRIISTDFQELYEKARQFGTLFPSQNNNNNNNKYY
ncbi:MAG: hypothetical protein HKM04_08775 [Legionellales bacterium]|nr:hypothetical protein [Legionellales bacterium]